MAFARLHALELKPQPDVQQLLFLKLTFLPKMRSTRMHSKDIISTRILKVQIQRLYSMALNYQIENLAALLQLSPASNHKRGNHERRKRAWYLFSHKHEVTGKGPEEKANILFHMLFNQLGFNTWLV